MLVLFLQLVDYNVLLPKLWAAGGLWLVLQRVALGSSSHLTVVDMDLQTLRESS